MLGHAQLWLDFMADTGDGGNPTYAVAAALAAPVLSAAVAPEAQAAAAAAAAAAQCAAQCAVPGGFATAPAPIHASSAPTAEALQVGPPAAPAPASAVRTYN